MTATNRAEQILQDAVEELKRIDGLLVRHGRHLRTSRRLQELDLTIYAAMEHLDALYRAGDDGAGLAFRSVGREAWDTAARVAERHRRRCALLGPDERRRAAEPFLCGGRSALHNWAHTRVPRRPAGTCRPRQRGAGRPRASATRSSARSGDSGSDWSDPPGPSAAPSCPRLAYARRLSPDPPRFVGGVSP